jgi:hypothetical protein
MWEFSGQFARSRWVHRFDWSKVIVGFYPRKARSIPSPPCVQLAGWEIPASVAHDNTCGDWSNPIFPYVWGIKIRLPTVWVQGTLVLIRICISTCICNIHIFVYIHIQLYIIIYICMYNIHRKNKTTTIIVGHGHSHTIHGMTGTSPGKGSTNQQKATSIVRGDPTNPTKSAPHQTIDC